MVIYLAGPIDLDTAKIKWREHVYEVLENNFAVTVYNPLMAFRLFHGAPIDSGESTFIECVNKEALYKSDIMLARITKVTPSVGVPIEIDMAFNKKIPIILLSDIRPGESVYLNNRIQSDNWIVDSNDITVWRSRIAGCLQNNIKALHEGAA